MSILKGIRVLDCSIAMAGPLAAQRLADLGADVIKIEPTSGEWQRHTAAGGATGNKINVSFLSLNRNKRSLSVDLKSPDGKEVLLEAVKTADVFIQNYRTGVATRLGVDYETLSAINPKLIYVSMSGYGETGPSVKRPGQDLLLQGMSGAMMATGAGDGPPQPAGQYLVDAITAYSAFEGALAALFHRERTGEGQKVSINMLDAITTIQMQELSVFTKGKVKPERTKEAHAHVYMRAPYGVFQTSDSYITLAFAPLDKLGVILGSDVLTKMNSETHGFSHRDEIFAITRKALLSKTSDEWLKIFDEAGMWAGPVYNYDQLLNDPQIKHNGTFISYNHPTEGEVTTPGFPIKFSKTPSEIRYGAPINGQHTIEVLKELGLDDEKISELIAKQAIHAGEDFA